MRQKIETKTESCAEIPVTERALGWRSRTGQARVDQGKKLQAVCFPWVWSVHSGHLSGPGTWILPGQAEKILIVPSRVCS